MNAPCPLCANSNTVHYFTDKKRSYQCCRTCCLVFTDKASWPTKQAEKNEYDLHENNVNDTGYNKFLNRIVEPLNERVKSNAAILDFGCGPAPALAKQLTELNHKVALYDIFYAPDDTVLTNNYDAIVLTEVIEHLHYPLAVLLTLWQQLNKNGVLAIMTQRVINQTRFTTWAYKNDPTHVCFYSDSTFNWLVKKLSATSVEFVGRDMVFIKK